MIKKIIAVVLTTFSLIASANQPVEFTVMHAAGGVSDLTSRFMHSNLNKNYSLMNRPGAAGKIAINHMLNEKNAMMLATMVQVYVTNPLSQQDLGYSPTKDFEVLSVVGVMPSALLCHKKTNIKSFKDFLSYDKSLSFGVGGYGSAEHVATESLLEKSNLKYTIVPYAQGGNKAVNDLLGGHIDCMFGNFPTVKPFVDHENLTLLMTSHNLGYSVSNWEQVYKKPFPFQSYLSIIVPTSMSKEVKDTIIKDIETSYSASSYKEGLIGLGLFPLMITDKTKIKEVVEYMNYIRNFIVKNNIKISG